MAPLKAVPIIENVYTYCREDGEYAVYDFDFLVARLSTDKFKVRGTRN